MDNFTFYSPTRFCFGKNSENELGKLLKRIQSKKVMIFHMSGPELKSGILDRVKEILKKEGIDYVEMGGVKANPRLDYALECIETAKAQKVDSVLAIGGGSCIDTAKATAAGVLCEDDFWAHFQNNIPFDRALPIGAIVTIAASGSEGSEACLLKDEANNIKVGLHSEVFRPAYAIENPELTFSLPKYQTACGITDIMMHVIERYFTNTKGTELTDQLSEGVLRTMIKYGPIVMKEPDDYEARAQIMWAGVIAHNDICGVGREIDLASHMIQDVIGGLYDSAHGAGLATICPAWMKYVYQHDIPRFVRYAEEVWNVKNDPFDQESTALEGIRRTKMFFQSLGMPVTLDELGVEEKDMDFLCKGRCVGHFVTLCEQDIREIYRLAK
ncbi:iron-containing alcohol dehydrogenase [Anaerostipes sp.]|uniref:iron-containing alcohol dehydrogenase n=1 Tax=Anaerostipes sp. TaxID=1872530 RepID=UPI0025B8D3BB|nr:iron-containing alcohol dehydrogenase [Anaerostipes sp.]MBS7009598.1 iron-containing alcohol dehydrogenase [Anaerostipes sp.]